MSRLTLAVFSAFAATLVAAFLAGAALAVTLAAALLTGAALAETFEAAFFAAAGATFVALVAA